MNKNPRVERAALILLGGELGDRRLIKRVAKRCRGILCADGGGLRNAAALKLKADFVIGDMDSLSRLSPRQRIIFKKTTYWCDFDENRSDFEKCLTFASGLGCDRIYVGGALGGATDHALINMSLFSRFSQAMELVLLDGGVGRVLGPGRYRLEVSKGARFSLLASGRVVVTLTGAKYALKRFELLPGSRGLGNHSTGKPVLTIHDGRAWVFQ